MTATTTTRRLGDGNKYGAKRTWSASCERWFDSKAEAARADELVLLERAGKIRELEFQPSWVLCERPRVTYTADFIYRDPSRMVNFADGPRLTQEPLVVVEDVKGYRRGPAYALFRLKAKLMYYVHGLEVVEI